MNQRTRQCHALLLTAGKFVGKGFPAIKQTDCFKEVLCLFPRPFAWHVIKLQRQADVFTNSQRWDQVKELENKSNAGASKKRAVAFGQGSQVLTIHPDLPTVWRVDAADQIEQRAFTTAAFAQDGCDLTGLEFGMRVLQNDSLCIAFVIGFGQVVKTKKRCHEGDCILCDVFRADYSPLWGNGAVGVDEVRATHLVHVNENLFVLALRLRDRRTLSLRLARNIFEYNIQTKYSMFRFSTLFILLLFLMACTPATVPSAELQAPAVATINAEIPPGFAASDGSRVLTFPKDFGPHEDFRTEWWYYTGNLQTPEGRHFGFELTIFRVGLLPPTVELHKDSQWYDRSLYFAHFAVSDIASQKFYAFERFSRPGPGLAGAQAEPYRVWLEDWNISEQAPDVYHLHASHTDIALDLTLTDEMGVVLHGENGYSRKGEDVTNASYYYSQPRLRADGMVEVKGIKYLVTGLAWKDHEFSTSVLDEHQIGWDWFSLQFEDGRALMLFQLRERDGGISVSSSGTWIDMNGHPLHLQKTDFEITVQEQWHSPHTQGVYPSAWEIKLNEPGCRLEIHPWMSDQELHFPTVTYWEGAVRFAGTCGRGDSVSGNGYVELTGYTGNIPLP